MFCATWVDTFLCVFSLSIFKVYIIEWSKIYVSSSHKTVTHQNDRKKKEDSAHKKCKKKKKCYVNGQVAWGTSQWLWPQNDSFIHSLIHSFIHPLVHSYGTNRAIICSLSSSITIGTHYVCHNRSTPFTNTCPLSIYLSLSLSLSLLLLERIAARSCGCMLRLSISVKSCFRGFASTIT